jgi:hypothetical protein
MSQTFYFGWLTIGVRLLVTIAAAAQGGHHMQQQAPEGCGRALFVPAVINFKPI